MPVLGQDTEIDHYLSHITPLAKGRTRACRAGDYVLWARLQNIFSVSGNECYKIADLWELRDGNLVTITNRHSGLPDWTVNR